MNKRQRKKLIKKVEQKQREAEERVSKKIVERMEEIIRNGESLAPQSEYETKIQKEIIKSFASQYKK